MKEEYKVVSIIFKDGKPDFTTMEEVIPLIVMSREDIEYCVGKVSDEQFNRIRDKALDMDMPHEEVSSWFDEEVCDEVRRELNKEE